MASKKSVKKLEKKTKKTTRKSKKSSKRQESRVSETAMKIRFHQKILEVMNQHPEIQCTGRGVDLDGNEYAYTEAAEVFSAYGQTMRELGLTCIPIEKTAVLGKNAYMIHVKFKLTDVDTGYSEIITGSGLGSNGQWAANTAQTLALKQALLETFNASWPQPPDYKDLVKKEAQNVFGSAHSPEEVVQAVKDYFGSFQLTKGQKDGRTSDSTNTSRTRRSHSSGRETSDKKSR